MALPKETRTIGEFQYEVEAFPAGMGLDILAELTALFGEAIGNTENGMGAATKALVERLDKSAVSIIAQRLIGRNVKINGQPMQGETTFDHHFACNYKQLVDVISFVLEFNYQDFFVGLKTMIVGLWATTTEESNTGEDSSDTSGLTDDQGSSLPNASEKGG